MKYQLAFKPRARKDLRTLSSENVRRVIEAIERLSDDLTGDVKRLTDTTPEYRLRVGDYRVLFQIEGDTVTVCCPSPRGVSVEQVHDRTAS